MTRHLTNAPANETGIFQRRRPQRQIITLPHQIQLIVAEGQLQHHLGIEGTKFGQDPAKQQGTGRLGGGDPHPPRRGRSQPRHRQIGATGQRQQRLALLHVDLTLRGQAEPAGGTLQQSHPSWVSSREIFWLTEDLGMPSASAAPVKLPCSTTVANSPINSRLTLFIYSNSLYQLPILIRIINQTRVAGNPNPSDLKGTAMKAIALTHYLQAIAHCFIEANLPTRPGPAGSAGESDCHLHQSSGYQGARPQGQG